MAKSPLGTKTRLSAVSWSIADIFFSSVSHLTSRMSAFSRSHELAFGTSVLHTTTITHPLHVAVCCCWYLARSTHLLTGLFILPSEISSFLNWPNISQHTLGRFSRSFSRMKGICVNFLDPDLFCQFLKGRWCGNRFLAKFARWPLFNTLAFRSGFDYRNFDSKTFNCNKLIFSTYYANLIKIGPVTPEKLQILPWFDDCRSFVTWRSEMDWKITILISAG